MNVKLQPAALRGTLPAIPSKSDAHRLLICAALADAETTIELPLLSRDMEATIRCLRALGAEIVRTGSEVRVRPLRGAVQSPVLDCGESGSTLRFLLPVAAAVSETPTFTGAGRLPERPVAPLLAALEERGKTVVSRAFPLRLAGRLTPGDFALPGDVSSQFVSGVLLASPLTGGDCEIRLTSALSSAGYVEMTRRAMRVFGVETKRTDGGFFVPCRPYRSPGRLTAEGDWSNAAFFLAAAALGGDVTLTGLTPDSAQPDRRIAELLRDYGADIGFEGGALRCRAGERRAFSLDADGCPDLVPVLCVLAACAAGRSRIENIGRLRGKESDRVGSCRAMIRALGGAFETDGDTILIDGRPELPGGSVDAAGDHRIVMAAAAAAAACAGPVEITGAEAAEKSYPNFFEDLRALGGQCGKC